MTWSSKNTARTVGRPALEREVACPHTWCFKCQSGLRHFLGTTTSAVGGGSLLEGLRLSMLKQGEHGGLRGLGYHSVIPYVHGRESCIAVYVVLFKAELNLRRVEVV
jgi:hypothetical protein